MTASAQTRRIFRFARFAAVVATACADFVVVPGRRRDVASRALWLQRHSRRTLRALGVTVESRGVPGTGEFIACNHVSYLDVLVLASQVPLVFVAKREVATWPLWGWLARAAGTVFVDRNRAHDVARVGEAIVATLHSRTGIVVFPEGTSTDGSMVLPFKTALLEPVLTTRRPAVPAAVGYIVPLPYCAGRDVCWWGDMTLVPHLWRLLAIPRIEGRITWGEAITGASHRKALAGDLHRTIASLHHTLGTTVVVNPAEPRAAAPGGWTHAD